MITALEKKIHNAVLEKNGVIVKTAADDYLKWLPLVLAGVADVFGMRTRTSWKRQVLMVAGTEAIRYLVADNLKKLTKERRPFPYTGKHSFPSGHTCTAFANAELMHMELKDSSPALSYAGYLTATAVAAIRIAKSRHWSKDVLAGAVIGILSAKLVYFLFDRVSKAKKPVKQMRRQESTAAEESLQATGFIHSS